MDFTVQTLEMNVLSITDNTTGEVKFYDIEAYGSVRACINAYLMEVWG